MTNPRWAFERAVLASDLPAPSRHILHALAVVADWPAGTTPAEHTPSLTKLAVITGLSRSTVADHLNRVEEAKWVQRARPDVARARADKERTRYRLRVPGGQEASPGGGLVQEADQSTSPGAGLGSPGAGPALVREPDGASPPAGHKPERSQTIQTAAGQRRAEAFVIEATGATIEEARAVVALVEHTDQPRSLLGFLRRLATDGDLTTRLDKIRSQRQRQAVDAQRRTWPGCQRCGIKHDPDGFCVAALDRSTT